jgi:ribosomal protein L11 methyltransferase
VTGARRWYALAVEVPPDRRELAQGVLWDHPLTGIEEDVEHDGRCVAFSARPWDPSVLEPELTRVCGAGVALRTFEVEDEDWLLLWKRDWKPTPLGERLVVVPAWWDAPLEPGRHVVRIDPGRAFGTGTHESTLLAWMILEETLARRDARRLLDVGTGTGVLSLGALALQPTLRALGTEADEQAMPSLRANLALNLQADRFQPVFSRALALRPGSIDLAVANLTAAEQSRVDVELAGAMAPAARVVLSGFLHPQLPPALERWHARGFITVRHRTAGEWSAVELERA